MRIVKAALLEGIRDLKITDIETPRCGRGDVLVKVESCGICRTDMKAYNSGQRDLRLPRILGHEIAGTVAETGKCVNQVKAGDRVQVAPGIPCGVCTYCLQGLHHLCDSVCTMGFHYNGGFAEYVLVPERGVRQGALNIIPEHLSFQEAALTEPLACTVNLQDTLAVQVGDAVVVFGAGPLGIINARLARARGAGTVILVEINEARLESAPPRDFDHRINALKEDPLKKVLEITGGKGADAVIPCCPDPSVFEMGSAMLAKRGRFGFFSGLVQSPPDLKVDLNPIHYKELRLYGAYGCSSYHNRKALELLASGMVTVKDLITLTIPLDQILFGLEKVKQMEEIKIIVNF